MPFTIYLTSTWVTFAIVIETRKHHESRQRHNSSRSARASYKKKRAIGSRLDPIPFCLSSPAGSSLLLQQKKKTNRNEKTIRTETKKTPRLDLGPHQIFFCFTTRNRMLSSTPTTVKVPPTMASTEVKKSYHLRRLCLMYTLIGLRS